LNTNVTREGHYYDANVTGSSFGFHDKKNMYMISGAANTTARFYPGVAEADRGYSADLNVGKDGGNFKYQLLGRVKTDRYNPNDLGLLFLSNNIETGGYVAYNLYKPFWKLNNMYNSLTVIYQRMYKPSAFWNFGIYGNSVGTFTKRFLTCGINYGFEPVITYDYYEPRIPGRFYTFPVNYAAGGFISSDYRKPFALDVGTNYRIFNENARSDLNVFISPRYRASNRLSFVFEVSRNTKTDDIGFVNYNSDTDTITFGRRNIETVSNIFSSVYKFTNRMSLSFRLRHYWSTAYYKGYYQLGDDGSLNAYSYKGDHNVNFNAFNIDMVFFWQFAPGSELNLVWKNAVLRRENSLVNDYYTNLSSSFSADQNNTLSLKVLYYLDYLTVRKGLRRPNR
jgi:hypothetical protein